MDDEAKNDKRNSTFRTLKSSTTLRCPGVGGKHLKRRISIACCWMSLLAAVWACGVSIGRRPGGGMLLQGWLLCQPRQLLAAGMIDIELVSMRAIMRLDVFGS